MEKRRISILGDSISTFAGYTPEEAVFYDSYVQWETGVKSVEDTWWMQVIKALDGELGTNHSLAGSMVSGNLSTSAMSYERIEKLGTNGIPDIILISAGCNDWGFCVLPEEFEDEVQQNPIDHADIDSPFPYLPVTEPVDVDNHEQDTQCPHEIHCFSKTPKVVFLLHNRKI